MSVIPCLELVPLARHSMWGQKCADNSGGVLSRGHLLPSDHASLAWRRAEYLGQRNQVMIGRTVLRMGLQRRGQRCQGSHGVAQGASEWAAGLAREGMPPRFSGFSSEVFLSLTGNCFLLGMCPAASRVPYGSCSLPHPFSFFVPGFLNTQPLSLPSVLPTSTVLHFMTFRGVVSECSPSQELLDQALRGSWGRLSPREQAWAREGARNPGFFL